MRLHAAVPAQRDRRGRHRATPSPAPGVIEAIADADVVLLPPSNPVVSRSAPSWRARRPRRAARHRAPVVGVSPIIGGAPVRGHGRRLPRPPSASDDLAPPRSPRLLRTGPPRRLARRHRRRRAAAGAASRAIAGSRRSRPLLMTRRRRRRGDRRRGARPGARADARETCRRLRCCRSRAAGGPRPATTSPALIAARARLVDGDVVVVTQQDREQGGGPARCARRRPRGAPIDAETRARRRPPR